MCAGQDYLTSGQLCFAKATWKEAFKGVGSSLWWSYKYQGWQFYWKWSKYFHCIFRTSNYIERKVGCLPVCSNLSTSHCQSKSPNGYKLWSGSVSPTSDYRSVIAIIPKTFFCLKMNIHMYTYVLVNCWLWRALVLWVLLASNSHKNNLSFA